MAGKRVLVLDNYDSFTYNLVQCLGMLGSEPIVYRSNRISLEDVERIRPRRIVVSPGPGAPDSAGISIPMIREYGSRMPILGVCLGHQCISRVYGGRVVRAERVMHGKTSSITHDGKGVFRGVANPLEAARYHSLVVDEKSLPGCLEVSGRTGDGVIMGLRHQRHPVEGIQFHPESFMTENGLQILENFLEG